MTPDQIKLVQWASFAKVARISETAAQIILRAAVRGRAGRCARCFRTT